MDHLFNLTIKPIHDKLEESYEMAMNHLNDFFEIDWIRNQPTVFIVEDRATIDCLRNEKSEPWVVGWSDRRKVFLLSREKMGIESDRTHSVEEYDALLAHELCHLFFGVSTGGQNTPTWLNEGLCGYISGQIHFKKKPEVFSSFLEFFDKSGAGVYNESAFAVKALIDASGKEKILELLRKIKEIGGNLTKDKFDLLFKEIYGFEPAYEVFNNFISSKDH